MGIFDSLIPQPTTPTPAPSAPAPTPTPATPPVAPGAQTPVAPTPAPKGIFDDLIPPSSSSQSQKQPPVTPSTPPTGGIFDSLIPKSQPDTSVAQPSTPATSPVKSPYFSTVDSKGNSIGFSDQTDVSGKPYFAFRNPGDTSTTTDTTRVATTFDPRVPQKLDPSIVQNGRMPQSMSDPIKKELGGQYSDELDHTIALELSGSNNQSNLKIEPGRNTTGVTPGESANFDKEENDLAHQVVTGKMSLWDAQVKLATDKSNAGDKNPIPWTAQAKSPSFWDSLKTKLGGAGADISNTLDEVKNFFTGNKANASQNQNPEMPGVDALRGKVLQDIPFTDKGKDIVTNQTHISLADPVTHSAVANTQSGVDENGKTTITIDSVDKPNDQMSLAHEFFNTIFQREKIDPSAFNKAWSTAMTGTDENSKTLQAIDAHLNDPTQASTFKETSKNGENVGTNPSALATERFAFAGSMLGPDGISSIPKALQPFFKDYISDPQADAATNGTPAPETPPTVDTTDEDKAGALNSDVFKQTTAPAEALPGAPQPPSPLSLKVPTNPLGLKTLEPTTNSSTSKVSTDPVGDFANFLLNPHGTVPTPESPFLAFGTQSQRDAYAARVGPLTGPRVITGPASLINNGLVRTPAFIASLLPKIVAAFMPGGMATIPGGFDASRFGGEEGSNQLQSFGQDYLNNWATADQADGIDPSKAINSLNPVSLKNGIISAFNSIITPSLAVIGGGESLNTAAEGALSDTGASRESLDAMKRLGINEQEFTMADGPEKTTLIGNQVTAKLKAIVEDNIVTDANGNAKLKPFDPETKVKIKQIADDADQVTSEQAKGNLKLTGLGSKIRTIARILTTPIGELGDETPATNPAFDHAELPGTRVRPGQAPAFGLSTQEVEPVGGAGEGEKPSGQESVPEENNQTTPQEKTTQPQNFTPSENKLTGGQMSDLHAKNPSVFYAATGKYTTPRTIEEARSAITNQQGKTFPMRALPGKSFKVNDLTYDHFINKPRSPTQSLDKAKLFSSALEVAENSNHIHSIDKSSGKADGIIYYQIAGVDPKNYPGQIVRALLSEKNGETTLFSGSVVPMKAPMKKAQIEIPGKTPISSIPQREQHGEFSGFQESKSKLISNQSTLPPDAKPVKSLPQKTTQSPLEQHLSELQAERLNLQDTLKNHPAKPLLLKGHITTAKLEDQDAKSLGSLLKKTARVTDSDIKRQQHLDAVRKAVQQSADAQKAAADAQAATAQALRKTIFSDAPKEGVAKQIARAIDPIYHFEPVTKGIMQKWFIDRTMAEVKANDEAKSLSAHKNIGIDSFIAQQNGAKIPVMTAHSENLFAESNRRGVEVAHQENYVHQAWANPPKVVQEAARKFIEDKLKAQGVDPKTIASYLGGEELPKNVAAKLKVNPSFSKAKSIPSYSVGIKMGLTPKYDTFPKLAAAQRRDLEISIANRTLEKSLVAHGKMIPVDLNASNVPKRWSEVTIFGKRYYAPNPIARFLNDYLRNDDDLTALQEFSKKAATATTIAQNIGLMTGVPGTTLQPWALKFLTFELAGRLNPKAIIPFIAANSDRATTAFIEHYGPAIHLMGEHGVPIGSLAKAEWDKTPISQILKTTELPKIQFTKSFPFVSYKPGSLGATSRALYDKGFQTKVYDRMIPMLAVQAFDSTYKAQIAKGADKATAATIAAADVNHTYVFRTPQGKTTSTLSKAIFYGPVWRQQELKMLWNAAKAGTIGIKNPDFTLGGPRTTAGGYKAPILNPRYKGARWTIMGLLATFAAYQVFNHKNTGHFTWENEPGHELDIDSPQADGSHLYTTFFSSFMTVPRIAVGTADALRQGDVAGAANVSAGLASQNIQTLSELFNNKNYFGQPIYKPTDASSVKYTKIAAFLGGSYSPSFVQAIVGYIDGKATSIQALALLSQGMMKYQTAASTASATISAAITAQVQSNADLLTKATNIYNTLKGQPDAAAQWDKINTTDPTLAAKIASLVKTDKLSGQEKQLKLLSVKTGNRAKAIAAIFNGMSDKAAKKALWDQLTSDKVMSATVASQVMPLLDTTNQ